MKRRLYLLLLLAAMISSLGLKTYAAGEGGIRVELRGGKAPVSGAQIGVYLAGVPTERGYRLTETFGGGLITQTDVFSPELAVWLSQRAAGGQHKRTDEEGCAQFSGLDEGLYLVVQDCPAGGYRSFEPFLVTIPWDGDQWQITAAPKLEREISVVPDTSDPGTLERGFLGMALSAIALTGVLMAGKKKTQ